MKTTLMLAVFTATLHSALGQEYQIAERGAHHRTFEKTTQRVRPDGTITTEKDRYIELASGLHYKQGEAWLESKEEVEIFDGAAVARQGAHQVIWSANANTAGAVDLLAPDGRRFRSHVLGIAYTDCASGGNVPRLVEKRLAERFITQLSS